MNYLILLPVCLRLVRVWVMLEELSHICHDGFLIRLVHVHVYRKTITEAQDKPFKLIMSCLCRY